MFFRCYGAVDPRVNSGILVNGAWVAGRLALCRTERIENPVQRFTVGHLRPVQRNHVVLLADRTLHFARRYDDRLWP